MNLFTLAMLIYFVLTEIRNRDAIRHWHGTLFDVFVIPTVRVFWGGFENHGTLNETWTLLLMFLGIATVPYLVYHEIFLSVTLNQSAYLYQTPIYNWRPNDPVLVRLAYAVLIGQSWCYSGGTWQRCVGIVAIGAMTIWFIHFATLLPYAGVGANAIFAACWVFACAFSLVDFVRQFAGFGWTLLLVVPAAVSVVSLFLFWRLIGRKVRGIRRALRVKLSGRDTRELDTVRSEYCDSLGLDSAAVAREWVQVGFEGGCDLFVNWTLHRYLVAKFHDDQSLLIFLARTASYFPGEFLMFNFVMRALSNVRLLSPTDGRLLFEVRCIFSDRQSFSSSESRSSLDEMKNAESQCKFALRDFWLSVARGETPRIETVLGLAKIIETGSAIVREIAGRHASHPLFLNELATFAIDVEARFLEGLDVHAKATRIDARQSISEDRCFVQFVRFLPYYLTEHLVNARGLLLPDPTRSVVLPEGEPTLGSGTGHSSDLVNDEVYDEEYLPGARLRIAMAHAVDAVNSRPVTAVRILTWVMPAAVLLLALGVAVFCSSVHDDLSHMGKALEGAGDVVGCMGQMMVLQPFIEAQRDGSLLQYNTLDLIALTGRSVPELTGDVMPFALDVIARERDFAGVRLTDEKSLFGNSILWVDPCGAHATENAMAIDLLLRTYTIQTELLFAESGSWLASSRRCNVVKTGRRITAVLDTMKQNVEDAVSNIHQPSAIGITDWSLLFLFVFVPLVIICFLASFIVVRLGLLPAERDDFVEIFAKVSKEDAARTAEQVLGQALAKAGPEGLAGIRRPASGAVVSEMMGICSTCECALLLVVVISAARTRLKCGGLLLELTATQSEFISACQVCAEAVRFFVGDPDGDLRLLRDEITHVREIGSASRTRFVERCPLELDGPPARFYECLSLDRLFEYIVSIVQSNVLRAEFNTEELLRLVHATAIVLESHIHDALSELDTIMESEIRRNVNRTWICAGVAVFVAVVQLIIQIFDVLKVKREYEVMRGLLLHLPVEAFVNNDRIMSKFLRTAGRDEEGRAFANAPEAIVELDSRAYILISLDGTLERVSPVTAELFELPSTIIVGQNVRALLPESDNPKLYQAFGQIRADALAPTIKLDVTRTRDDGTQVSLGCTVVGAERNHARVTSFGVILRSKSAAKEAEARAAQLKASNDRLQDMIFPTGFMSHVPKGVTTLNFDKACVCAVKLSGVEFASPEAFLNTLQGAFEWVNETALPFQDLTRIRCIGDEFLFASGLFPSTGSFRNEFHSATNSFQFATEVLNGIQPLNMTLDVELEAKIAIHIVGPVVVGLFGRRRGFDIVGTGLDVLQRILAICPKNAIMLTKTAKESIPTSAATAGITLSNVVLDGVEDLFEAGRRNDSAGGSWRSQRSIRDGLLDESGWAPPSLGDLLGGGGVGFGDLLFG